MERAQYSDVIGIPPFKYHEILWPWLGLRVTRFERESPIVKATRYTFIAVTDSICVLEAVAISRGIMKALDESDYEPMGQLLTALVCIFSAVQKHITSLLNIESFVKVGEFIVRERQLNPKRRPTLLQGLIKNGCFSYYMGLHWLLSLYCIFPLFTSLVKETPHVYPFVSKEMADMLIFPMKAISGFYAVSTVSFVMLTSMSTIGMLQALLVELNEGWKQLKLQNFHEDFRKLVKRHNDLIWFHKEINKIVGGVFVVQALISTCLTGMTILVILMHTQAAKGIIVCLTTGVCTGIEVSFLCYLGDEVSHQFEQLHRSIYTIKWYEMTRKEKSSILIAQENMKRTYKILGGGVIPVDLHTAVQIYQDAFSFYVLVRAVIDKQ